MWWSITTISIWVSGCVLTAYTKDGDFLIGSFVTLITLGLFYLCLHG